MPQTKKDHFDQAREEASVRMFTHGDTWPNLILPVKNYKMAKGEPFGKLGVITNPAVEQLPLVIYETNLFAPDFENCHKFEYTSVQEAIEAGWVVD